MKDLIKKLSNVLKKWRAKALNPKLPVVLFLVVLLGLGYNIFITKSIPVMILVAPARTVVIDPGHGTIDQGVVHQESGVAESPINLAVSFKLRDILTRQKFNVVLTRDRKTQEQEGNHEELKRRVDMADSSNADIFVSIHVNQYPDPSCFGAQCFYNPQKPESKLLAMLVQEELKALEPENFREALPQDLFILRESPVPAVLVEMGFISNPSDRQKLLDPSYQKKMAGAIAKALNRYFDKDAPKHTPEYN